MWSYSSSFESRHLWISNCSTSAFRFYRLQCRRFVVLRPSNWFHPVLAVVRNICWKFHFLTLPKMGNLLAGKKKPGKHVSNSGMIPCESHPDLHMGTCHLCYVPSTTERLQAAVRDTLPAVKRGKSGVSDGLISCSGSLDTQLVSFQSFSDEGIGTSGDSSPVTSVPVSTFEWLISFMWTSASCTQNL